MYEDAEIYLRELQEFETHDKHKNATEQNDTDSDSLSDPPIPSRAISENLTSNEPLPSSSNLQVPTTQATSAITEEIIKMLSQIISTYFLYKMYLNYLI